MTQTYTARLNRQKLQPLLTQYQAIRENVGLTDCSDWCKIKISGYDAREFLDRVLTGNLQQLAENEILHTMALDTEGNFLTDLLVLGGFEDFVLLVPAAQADALTGCLKPTNDEEVEITDQSSDLCLIRIDGPNTADLPMAILGGAVSGLRIMAFAEAELNDQEITVARIGLAGEYGYLFLAPVGLKADLQDAIRKEAPDASDCEAILHDLLQLETRGFNAATDRPQNEHPLEAGLHWMVDFHKPEFTGRDGFFAAADDCDKQMVCLALESGSDAPNILAEIVTDGSEESIGYVAHAAWSPTLEAGICLAYLNKDWAAVGLTVKIGDISGTIVSAPFFTTRSNSAR